jgi:hypothetical protein
MYPSTIIIIIITHLKTLKKKKSNGIPFGPKGRIRGYYPFPVRPKVLMETHTSPQHCYLDFSQRWII